MFELNWVFDEIFVRKDIYDTVFKEFGIDFLPVLLYKKDTILENTVQLKIPMIEKNALNLENQLFEKCKSCGRKKYSPHVAGFFPSFKNEIPNSLQIFKCNEFFGSEGEAHNKIFINKKLYEKIRLFKINPVCGPVAHRI